MLITMDANNNLKSNSCKLTAENSALGNGNNSNNGLNDHPNNHHAFLSASQQQQPSNMTLYSDEVNYLIYRYLQESGFVHSAFSFAHESMVGRTGLRAAEKSLPPGALITFLQKGLQYVGIEESLYQQEQHSDTASVSSDRAEVKGSKSSTFLQPHVAGENSHATVERPEFSLLSPLSIAALSRRHPPIQLNVPATTAAAAVKARLEAEAKREAEQKAAAVASAAVPNPLQSLAVISSSPTMGGHEVGSAPSTSIVSGAVSSGDSKLLGPSVSPPPPAPPNLTTSGTGAVISSSTRTPSDSAAGDLSQRQRTPESIQSALAKHSLTAQAATAQAAETMSQLQSQINQQQGHVPSSSSSSLAEVTAAQQHRQERMVVASAAADMVFLQQQQHGLKPLGEQQPLLHSLQGASGSQSEAALLVSGAQAKIDRLEALSAVASGTGAPTAPSTATGGTTPGGKRSATAAKRTVKKQKTSKQDAPGSVRSNDQNKSFQELKSDPNTGPSSNLGLQSMPSSNQRMMLEPKCEEIREGEEHDLQPPNVPRSLPAHIGQDVGGILAVPQQEALLQQRHDVVMNGQQPQPLDRNGASIRELDKQQQQRSGFDPQQQQYELQHQQEYQQQLKQQQLQLQRQVNGLREGAFPMMDRQIPENVSNKVITAGTKDDLDDVDTSAREDEILKLEMHQSEVFMCSWNPIFTNLIATGSGDASARIWEMHGKYAAAGLKSVKLLPHGSDPRDRKNKDVTTLEWSPDGALLATGSYDGVARVWAKTGSLIHTLQGHHGPIFSLKWNKQGNFLLSGSYDKTTMVWDVSDSSGHAQQQFTDHRAPALDVDWKDNETFASCSTDKTVHICRVGVKRPIKVFSGHTDEVNAVKWDPSGRFLASCSDDCTAKVWDVESDRPEPLYDFKSHQQEIYTVKWSPTGPGSPNPSKKPLLATASFDGSVRLWKIDDGSCYRVFSRHRDSVYSVAFSPSGEYLASGSLAGQMYIWDIEQGRHVKSYKGKGDIFEVAWNKEETRVAACFSSNVVAVVDFDKSKL